MTTIDFVALENTGDSKIGLLLDPATAGANITKDLQSVYDDSTPASITLNGTNGGIVIDPNGESEPIQITGWLEMDNTLADKKLVVGYDNTTGQEAHCIGWQNDMSGGQRNFVFGHVNDLSNASCEECFIVGYGNTCNGDDIMIHGFSNTCASGAIIGNNNNWGSHGCFTLGSSNTGTTFMTNSVITGNGNTITGQLIDGMVQGRSNSVTTSQTSHTIGYQNTVSQSARGLCVGFSNDVNEDDEICLGHSNVVNGFYSTTLGRENTVSAGDRNYVVGYSNEISNSERNSIFGHGNNLLFANTDDCIITGNNNESKSRNVVIYGKNNDCLASSTTRQENLCVIGSSNDSGTSWCTNSIIAGNLNTVSSTFIGSSILGQGNNTTNGNNVILLGKSNTFNNGSFSSITVGINNTHSASRSLSLGQEINITSNRSGAISMNSTEINHVIDDNIGFYFNQGTSLFEGDDDRDQALCSGNLQRFTFSGDVDNLTDTVLFSFDTSLVRSAGVSQCFTFRINTTIYRSDASSGVAEMVETLALLTWRDSITTLSLQPAIYTTLISGDYSGTLQCILSGNNLNFTIPSDLTNSYHIVGDCQVSVCSVGV